MRLVGESLEARNELRLFLMNDSVDMARDICKPTAGYDQDLIQMLKDLIAKGAPVKVCRTCTARCRICINHPYFERAEKSTMPELAQWVVDNDRAPTF